MSKLFLLFLLFLSMCSFLIQGNRLNGSEKKSKIFHQLTNKISTKHNLKRCGGGKRKKNDHFATYLAFETNHSYSKDEARFILLDILATYIETLNPNKNLQQHFSEIQYSIELIEVAIFIHNENGEMNFFPDLGLIEYRDGFLEYSTYEPGKLCEYQTRETETIREALNKLEEQNLMTDFIQTQF